MDALETVLSNCDQNAIRRSREHVENISRQATGHSVKYVVRTHVLARFVDVRCSCPSAATHSRLFPVLVGIVFWGAVCSVLPFRL